MSTDADDPTGREAAREAVLEAWDMVHPPLLPMLASIAINAASPKLMEKYDAELAAERSRVKSLEMKLKWLEAHPETADEAAANRILDLEAEVRSLRDQLRETQAKLIAAELGAADSEHSDAGDPA